MVVRLVAEQNRCVDGRQKRCRCISISVAGVLATILGFGDEMKYFSGLGSDKMIVGATTYLRLVQLPKAV